MDELEESRQMPGRILMQGENVDQDGAVETMTHNLLEWK